MRRRGNAPQQFHVYDDKITSMSNVFEACRCRVAAAAAAKPHNNINVNNVVNAGTNVTAEITLPYSFVDDERYS